MATRDHTDLERASHSLLRALGDEPYGDTIKQVLVYRRDLKMRKGKIAAQCSHSSWIPFLDRKIPRHEIEKLGLSPNYLVIPLTDEMATWIYDIGFTKIVLTVETEEDLLQVFKLAKEAGIPAALVTDAGHTEFKKTCPDCGGAGYLHSAPGCVEAPPCPTCRGTGKVNKPTNTAVGLGPALASEIDAITGPEGAVPTKLP